MQTLQGHAGKAEFELLRAAEDGLGAVVCDGDAAALQVGGGLRLKLQGGPSAGLASCSAAFPLLGHTRIKALHVHAHLLLLRHQLHSIAPFLQTPFSIILQSLPR